MSTSTANDTIIKTDVSSASLSAITPALPSASTAAAAVAWDIDPSHSSAGFRVRHLMVSHVRGALGTVSGTVWLDDGQLQRSRVDVSIDARGIDTRDAKRDEHLRSADFLDVDNHPAVTFRSTSVRGDSGRASDEGQLLVEGELTIRGVSRPVTLAVDPLPPAVVDPWGNTKRGATARTRINRKDWGLKWNMALEAGGGVVVGEEVSIELEIELVKRVATA